MPVGSLRLAGVLGRSLALDSLGNLSAALPGSVPHITNILPDDDAR